MAENKTKKTDASVADFLSSVENDQRREDALEVAALMQRITGIKPKMWGSAFRWAREPREESRGQFGLDRWRNRDRQQLRRSTGELSPPHL